MSAPSATSAIRAAVPSDRERNAGAYAIDGESPAVAFRPQSREEVARLLAAASEAGLAVTPQGGRTALALGRPLAAYDIALDTMGLDRMVAYEPDDLTVTVEAGVTLERLQSLLHEQGQYLPIDPPPDDGVSIGGLLATARPGAWRGHVPAARDLVLGIQVAQPDGALVKSGGRVVKNVSGYDMHRLHTGALGAFGVIVEASFKLAPLPEATQSLVVQCGGPGQAEAVAFELWERPLATRALILLTPRSAPIAGLPAAAHVLIEFAGSTEAVDRSVDVAREVVAASGLSAQDAEPWTALRAAAGDAGSVVLRLGVPATAVPATLEAAESAGCTAWGHPASGSVIARAGSLEAAAVRSLRETAMKARGFLQIESAPASLRGEVDPFDMSEVGLVRALKQQFDPSGTLNRGRWLEGV